MHVSCNRISIIRQTAGPVSLLGQCLVYLLDGIPELKDQVLQLLAVARGLHILQRTVFFLSSHHLALQNSTETIGRKPGHLALLCTSHLEYRQQPQQHHGGQQGHPIVYKDASNT